MIRRAAIGLGLAVGVAVALLVPRSWLLAPQDEHEHASSEIWACPMLCVKRDGPGTCPVCGMDLEKLEDTGDAVVLSQEQARMIGLETARVERRVLKRRLRTVGIIDYNERHVRTISAWVAGRIDRLYADSTWSDVRKDDHVLQLYSPELFAAQQELLAGGSTRDAARRKLELMGMSEAQIVGLQAAGKASEWIDILSPISGKVIALKVTEGSYVEKGQPLYTVADFSTFWLRLDAYEQDLSWIAPGQSVEVTLDALPGQTFPGTVSFIEGIVDPRTRTTKVRVTVDNRARLLKPGMYADVAIQATLAEGGRALQPSLDGRYRCYMHPEERSDGPGACPICEMPMELITHEHPRREASPLLAVLRTAVLSTGERHVVYVMTRLNAFELRVIRVGARAGDYVHVLEGLEEGEQVATRGAFLVDSQMQLTGRPSLVNP